MTMISEDRLGTLLKSLPTDEFAGVPRTWVMPVSFLREIVTELLSLRTSPPPSGEAGEGLEQARAIVDAMVSRDDRNNFLPAWWRDRLDLLKAALHTIKEPTDGK